MRKLLFSCLLLSLYFVATGQVEYNYRYWFDGKDDVAFTGTSSTASWTLDADVSELDVGFHTFYLQVDTSGVQSAPLMRYFFKPLSSSASCKYWFDDDYSNAQPFNSSVIDVSHLSDGMHALSFVAEDNGVFSSVQTRWFIKVMSLSTSGDMTCVCMIDGEEFAKEKLPSNGGVIDWLLDVNSLSQGLHKAQVFCITPNGTMTTIQEDIFLRIATTNDIQSMRCYYTIDGDTDEGYIQEGSCTDGLFHFDLDVSSISDGLHRLSYLLVGESGVATRAKTAFFIKTPLGGSGVVKWEYCVNDNDTLIHSTILDEKVNPLEIVSLLPVETYPIRSSCFEFRVEDENPVLYAKNDIYFRFYDNTGHIVDAKKQYVDESVREEVPTEEIVAITPGQITNMPRPGDNEIKWFKFEGEIGDSIWVKMDRACTVDVFSPSGEAVYSASGSESVVANGKHLLETGAYYVAVHDVTAVNGSTLNLDLQKIDKYAVLSYTPNRIGLKKGTFSINLFGNGYEMLDSVKLINGEVELVSDTVTYIDNANADLKFTVADADACELGDYDMKLYFSDNGKRDSLLLSEAVKLEEAVYGEIEVTVKFDRILAMPYPITIKVKNMGNVGYMGVPINIAFDNYLNVERFQFTNFCVDVDTALVNRGLESFVVTDNLLGTGRKGCFAPMIIPYLAPYEEMELEVAVTAGGHTRFNLYAWAGEPWSTTIENRESQSEEDETVDTNLPNLDEVSDITGIVIDDLDVIEKAIGNSDQTSLVEIGGNSGNAYYTYIAAAAPCKSKHTYYNTGGKNVYVLGSAYCISVVVNKPNFVGGDNGDGRGYDYCIPTYNGSLGLDAENDNPMPEPTNVEVLAPGDPNEMHGYTSESGSLYINGKVTDVFYSIECENDTAIATAAAHTIIVTDTIDSRYHDLSTFGATSVKLGPVTLELDGEKEFVKTMDLRPNINVIAQVVLDYDESAGIAKWTITSLDPMTMEPVNEAARGALPADLGDTFNSGFFNYDIKLKEGLADGTEIMSRAAIVFDNEEPVITPNWVNTVDNVAPTSKIDTVEFLSDSLVNVRFSGNDERSGLWRYTLYAQKGEDADWKIVVNDIEADTCVFSVESGIDYGFYVVATDSAGNVEPKLVQREFSYASYASGDANVDGVVDAQDIVAMQNIFLNTSVSTYSVRKRRASLTTITSE